MKIKNLKDLSRIKDRGLAKLKPEKPRIAVGMSTCGIGNYAQEVFDEFEKELKKQQVDAFLTQTGCFGFCAQEPFVNIYVPGKALSVMSNVELKDVREAVANIKKAQPLNGKSFFRIEEWDHHTSQISYGREPKELPLWNEIPFYRGQQKDVLRNCGIINPLDIEEYIATGGYNPLYEVLHNMSREEALNEIKESGLRGRGGAGFPVWLKWQMLKENSENPKYIFCNADEGDPGAYMNRNELEGDPHMVIEGMIIAAYITGASQGVIYCRAEYPVAVSRLREAIKQARSLGLLGKKIMAEDFSFDISIVEGAGAFVCGEETALISSVHGNPGWPMPRPPYPSEKGLYDKPTCINNVETLSNIAMIISRGGESFARTGTEKSTGTKVFSLVGKIKNTGLVELPLGTKLKTLIYDIGGGVGNEKKVKAVQTGGPSGGCIPASKFSSTIDYEALAEIGAIMGSGGVVVMDEDNCMVDVAHYFTEFTTSESCGKCVPCREGINHSLAMLSQIKKGEGSIELLNELQTLSDVIKDSALCGLGQTGPNPVVTTMKYFRDEYLMHIKEHYCDGGVCEDLFKSPCQNSCPLHMNIPGYLQLLKEDRVEEAFELVIRENPLPSSLGRICHFHCKMRCRRDDIDAPVAQGEVHRYIADKIYQEGKLDGFAQTLKKEIKIKGGKKIAIIGSGPAGLSAAFYLSLLGHKVKVFEKKNEPGGILRWGIPPYRLPREVLTREIDFIEKLGVDIKTSREINASEFKKLKKEHDAVVIAAGAYKSRRLDIPGADIKGVISGTDFLEDTSLYEKSLSGENVVVIGGGNVAVDAARTALRLGAKVNIVYRRGENEMPAIKQEIEDAKEESIQFSFWRSPQKFKAKDGKLKSVELKVNVPGSYDYSGRRKPVPSSEKEVMDCGLAIVAVGESVDRDFLDNCSIDISSRGGAKVDLFTMKASEGVYAAGDIVSGPATAAEAMAQGKKLARSLDFDLMEKNRFKIFDKNFNYEQKAPRKPSGKGPAGTKKMSVSKRKNNFNEVRKGFTLNQAKRESERCMRCDVKDNRGDE